MLHGAMQNDAPRELGGKKAFECTVMFSSRWLCRKDQSETFGNTCPQLS